MYCNKCGKFIESGNVCAECQAEEQTKANDYVISDTILTGAPTFVPQPDPTNRMFGFGKALASTIMSYFGFIFVYVALIASIADAEVAAVLYFLATPLVVIPLIFGIQSIKTFVRRKATCAKPVATLVLGIVGLATSAIAALIEAIGLLALLAML